MITEKITVESTAKEAYRKPMMEVYAMEVEGSILAGSGGVATTQSLNQYDDSSWNN